MENFLNHQQTLTCPFNSKKYEKINSSRYVVLDQIPDSKIVNGLNIKTKDTKRFNRLHAVFYAKITVSIKIVPLSL